MHCYLLRCSTSFSAAGVVSSSWPLSSWGLSCSGPAPSESANGSPASLLLASSLWAGSVPSLLWVGSSSSLLWVGSVSPSPESAAALFPSAVSLSPSSSSAGSLLASWERGRGREGGGGEEREGHTYPLTCGVNLRNRC